jgi:hypothetical protein
MTLKNIICILLCFFMSSSYAQRKGSTDTGGYLSFRSLGENDSTKSSFDVEWSFGFYMSGNFLIELQPVIQLDVLNDKVDYSTMLLSNFSLRLINMEPDEYRRHRDSKTYDRTTAGVYGFIGGGLWFNGKSQPNVENTYSVGPAFSLGIATHSALSKLLMVKTKIQYIYLAPAGEFYTSPRSMFKLGAGLSVFIRI